MGLSYRIQNTTHKQELLRGLCVTQSSSASDHIAKAEAVSRSAAIFACEVGRRAKGSHPRGQLGFVGFRNSAFRLKVRLRRYNILDLGV